MLEIIKHENLGEVVSYREILSKLYPNQSQTALRVFINRRFSDLINDESFSLNKDYFVRNKNVTHNNATKDYFLTINSAKQLVLVERKSPYSAKYRRWLISLEEAKDTKELLTTDEFLFIYRSIKALQSKLSRDKALKMHKDAKLGNDPKGVDFANFWNYRSSLLGYTKEELEAALKSKGIRAKHKDKSIEKMLMRIDKDEIFRSSLIDFLIGGGSDNKNAINLGNAAKRICEGLSQEDKTIFFDKTNTLYFDPENHRLDSVKFLAE
jgi:phage anti-repressor protein